MSKENTTWIFQANPNNYDILRSLKVEPKDSWGCRQHAKKISSNDRVLIWVSGKQAGIYAIGRTLNNPEPDTDSQIGMKYWKNPNTGRIPRPRVWVKI